MELKDFIKGVLVQVMTGVEEAQTELKENESTAIINAAGDLHKRLINVARPGPQHRVVENIEIDVALTIEGSTGTDRGGGINVLKVLEVGMGKNSHSLNSTTHRVKMQIPVAYPYAMPQEIPGNV